MSRLRLVCLIFISLFLGSCMQGLLQIEKQDFASLPSLISLSETSLKFKAELTIYDISLSGIMIAKKGNKGDVFVTFVNEFGLKYFDAHLDAPDTKMIYCIKPLDKRKFTNVVLHDLSIFFLPSANEGANKKNYSLNNFSYHYSKLENKKEQIEEYKKKKLVSIYLQESNEEYKVTHPDIRIKISLKLI